MIDFMLEYWVQFGFGLIAACMGILAKKVQSKVKESAAIKDGMLAILHDRLVQAGTHFINENGITLFDMENIEGLYQSYHNLGGNGTGTEIYERVKDLPIK